MNQKYQLKNCVKFLLYFQERKLSNISIVTLHRLLHLYANITTGCCVFYCWICTLVARAVRNCRERQLIVSIAGHQIKILWGDIQTEPPDQ